MPVALTYPGVYVEEIKSSVHTIIGVATSVTAFVGKAPRGAINTATTIHSFGDYEREFGGLSLESSMSYAVRDFFVNGGQTAVIVRLFHQEFATVDESMKTAVKSVIDAASGAAEGKSALDAAQKALDTLNKSDKSTAGQKAAATLVVALLNDAIEDTDTKARVTAFCASISAGFETVPTMIGYGRFPIGLMKPDKTVGGSLKFIASSPGNWGQNLRVVVDQDSALDDVAQGLIGPTAKKSDLFTLTVTDTATSRSERFLNLTVKDSARRVDKVLAAQSGLLRYDGPVDPTTALGPGADPASMKQNDVTDAQQNLLSAQMSGVTGKDLDPLRKGVSDAQDAVLNALAATTDGGELTAADFLPDNGMENKLGLFALEQLYARDELFNLLCIPPYSPVSSVGEVDCNVHGFLLDAATSYCESRRAMLIIDPPSGWNTPSAAKSGYGSDIDTRSSNAALFFPRVQMANQLHDGQIETFVPCGIVAGIFARTDTQRGVWKAPAGIDTSLVGASSLSVPMTDGENGDLNPLGVNCLRNFPIYGRVIWGSRTLKGADAFADEYKYIPVRRTALYIEESLYRGTQWVVFEPNDEPLWASIRLNVGAFMHNLFRQGAFQGSTPKDAYFVKCDKDTTTQNDIDAGIVNILVGFAPLKPAEFVVIQLQQIAGQIQT